MSKENLQPQNNPLEQAKITLTPELKSKRSELIQKLGLVTASAMAAGLFNSAPAMAAPKDGFREYQTTNNYGEIVTKQAPIKGNEIYYTTDNFGRTEAKSVKSEYLKPKSPKPTKEGNFTRITTGDSKGNITTGNKIPPGYFEATKMGADGKPKTVLKKKTDY